MNRQFRILREKEGLTRKQLSKMVSNISESSIANWEMGRNQMNIESVSALCESMGYELRILIK